MTQVARERIADLFALAENEARRADSMLADRYVALARRIGMRYNVRLLAEYRELYCRGCSAYWVEGRTVRTRLRGGRRVRSCQRCGRIRRLPIAPRRAPRQAVGVYLSARAVPAVTPVSDAVLDEGDDLEEGETE